MEARVLPERGLPHTLLPFEPIRRSRVWQNWRLIPGLSGHEGRVRRHIAGLLKALGLSTRTDRLGNLIATLEGDLGAPSVMLFTHMDQLGFVVRKIEPDGFLRFERLGGIPLVPRSHSPATPVSHICTGSQHANEPGGSRVCDFWRSHLSVLPQPRCVASLEPPGISGG